MDACQYSKGMHMCVPFRICLKRKPCKLSAVFVSVNNNLPHFVEELLTL